MTLPGPAASVTGLGQWELQRRQHWHDEDDTHSPALLVGKAKQSTNQLLAFGVCVFLCRLNDCKPGGNDNQSFSPLPSHQVHLLSQVRGK